MAYWHSDTVESLEAQYRAVYACVAYMLKRRGTLDVTNQAQLGYNDGIIDLDHIGQELYLAIRRLDKERADILRDQIKGGLNL